MIARNRKKLFQNLIVLAITCPLIASLAMSVADNPIEYIYLIILPSCPFILLAVMVGKRNKKGEYLHSTGSIKGAMTGALYAIGIPLGLLWFSSITYSGGGVNIGLGLLWLATPLFVGIAVTAGYSYGFRKHVNSLKRPIEVTALIMVFLVMQDRKITDEMRDELISQFVDVFKLSENKSSALFERTFSLLVQDEYPVNSMAELLKPSINIFSEEQAMSALALITNIANYGSPANSSQNEIIEDFKNVFRDRFSSTPKWG